MAKKKNPQQSETNRAKMMQSTAHILAAFPLHQNKFKMLCEDERARKEYLAAVDEVADYLMEDTAALAEFLQNTDTVSMTLVYNENRDTLEPVIGRLDGRKKRDRVVKLLHAAEMFDNAPGRDQAMFGVGAEELELYSSSSSSGSSACSSCDAGGSSLLGCCIIHFWGWTHSGSCSPCNDSLTDIQPQILSADPKVGLPLQLDKTSK
ncbi:MAG: hypothetical protein P8166_18125 [Candidatus Thiodiazotropha sp.]